MGERAAIRYLEREGFYIWKQNWKCRLGEIDLVAYRHHTLVIVEVKARTAKDGFRAIDRIDHKKSLRLRKLATRFWELHRVERKARRLWSVRIDGLGVRLSRWGTASEILHVENLYPIGEIWEKSL